MDNADYVLENLVQDPNLVSNISEMGGQLGSPVRIDSYSRNYDASGNKVDGFTYHLSEITFVLKMEREIVGFYRAKVHRNGAGHAIDVYFGRTIDNPCTHVLTKEIPYTE
jgi:hypothetical protein